ncbi:MAG: associated protein [Pelosinus sp.]|jgi:uncharacterized membrane protein YdjX (TVP38/TMEM64 family)|nr:associated protein [Pelosinus sp.]
MICEKKSAIKAGFFLVLLLSGLLLVHAVGISRFTPESIRNVVISFGWWGPVVYVFMYSIRPLLLFPAIILTLAGGLAFGPWWGTFYVVLGGVIGACLCFVIARLLGREKMQKYMGKSSKLQLFENKMSANGFRTMLFMRIVPIFPYDPVSYLAGLSKIRFRDYVSATTLGMIPGAFAYNVLGYSLLDVFSSTFLVAIGLIVIAFLAPLGYHFLKQR